MEYPIIIILLACIQYLLFGLRTGIARAKFGIEAPRVSGNETWERYNRVHLNTLEQLIVFIPALIAFSYYVSPKWALIPGIAFLIARQAYSYLYIKNPNGRGFPPTFLINVSLVIGSLIGVVVSLINK